MPGIALPSDPVKPMTFNLDNAPDLPDHTRLPRFYTSDPGYDAFINDYFMRHLSVDDDGVYTGGVKLGIVDQLWTIEWDIWMLPWIDRGAMGLRRQGGSPIDVLLTTLANVPVDKFGYCWGARLCPEPNNSLGGYQVTFGWPWPKYNRNTTTPTPTGWDFNDPSDGQRDKWAAEDMSLEPGYVDCSLTGEISGPSPKLTAPAFDTDVFQVPIVEIDITYEAPDGKRADSHVGQLRIYWTTNDSPGYSEANSVGVNYADLPPDGYPECYAPYVSTSKARYVLYFPMYLHPNWGRAGRRITGLKVVPAGSNAEGVKVSLNYVRATYDVRLTTSNTTLINGVYKFYMWSGNDDFLRLMLPKMHRAMVFLNEHLNGRRDGLLNFDWMVGKDGLGGDQSGHGLHGSYWDLLPSGRYDIESSMQYYYALCALAKLDEIAARKGWQLPAATVIGPDNKARLAYNETPESLRKLAALVKKNVETRFWVKTTGRFCRNLDVNGKQHDYGFLHFNLLALAFGLGTPAQRDSILSWLDGRVIAGDTSTGKDIYKWRFAPRTSTKHNTDYYYWAWIVDARNDAQATDNKWAYSRQFGNQMQDGGAVGFTSLFELMARAGTGRQSQIDAAFDRTREIQSWYAEVRAVGGKGPQFYRAYYDGHPERGYQQSPAPGGLGLDHEFLSDSSLATVFPLYAFLGVEAVDDGVLGITPAIPSKFTKVGVTNVFYRGNHLTIEAGKDYVSLEGSSITNGEGLKVSVTFRNTSRGCKVCVGDTPVAVEPDELGRCTVVTDLRPVRIEISKR